MNPTGWSLTAADTLDELLDKLATCPDTRILAGGTDLLVQKQARVLPGGPCIDVSRIGELKHIERLAEGWRIGAAASYSQLLADSALCTDHPMLATAARATGGWAIRNMGTLGGNIANASPAADSVPALLCYDAELELRRRDGIRRLPLVDFHLAYRKTALQPGECITAILLPNRDPRAWREAFVKVGTREAQSIAKVGLAMNLRLRRDGDTVHVVLARLAAGAVAPTPLRLHGCESLLTGVDLCTERITQVLDCLQHEISPIDDLRSTARYRRHAAGAVLERFLNACLEKPS
jgi:CO/xanthine dehydrogenase FAD-binding subunit